MYRWVDAQGDVHFSSTPPPGSAAEKYDPAKSSGRIQNVVPDHAQPTKPAARPAPRPRHRSSGWQMSPQKPRAASGPRTEKRGGRSESEWRSEAERMQREIDGLERQLEATESGPEFSNTTYGEYGLRTGHSNKASKLRDLERRLDQARELLDAFEDRAREADVPPGWLR